MERAPKVRAEECADQSVLFPDLNCYDNDEDTHSYGTLPGGVPNFAFVYSKATVTKEGKHYTTEGGFYPAGGFLLPAVQNYVGRNVSVHSDGSFFYRL